MDSNNNSESNNALPRRAAGQGDDQQGNAGQAGRQSQDSGDLPPKSQDRADQNTRRNNDTGRDSAGGDNEAHGDDGDGAQETQRKRPGKKPLIILGVVVLILIVVGLYFWLTTRNQETTDDAFTESDAVTVAPKVGGYVVNLAVRDNQRVHKGDLLLQIDARDYRAQHDQALAQLGLAEAQLHQAEAQLALSRVQYPAQLAQAQQARADANLQNAEAEFRRQRGVDPRATTQQNIDTASAQVRAARADAASARAQVEVAAQVALQINQAEATVEARQQQVRQAKAQLETADLNLAYTDVRAPFDGYVTRRNVQPGMLVQAGSALFSVVSPDIWVMANFKESQLERMRPGNKVEITVDAFPDMKLQGHVDSVQQGTGSRFSAFPAENATGNFVKIVQRVPVKIVIDSGLDANTPLPLGLSVAPKVLLE
ncbi:efflux RND transporter periplasmic adaptor subunit [Sodalis sp. RH22]|uniref:HlyD family secretion protein n=1 Tax=unclassified Sodalis (in: enterobacteria) TaxID=2636512 RepID=UPI0039B47198